MNLTKTCSRRGRASGKTGQVKAFLGWIAAGSLSILLGLVLYSTSLQGSAAGYQETAVTPQPTETVIKTKIKKKIIRKPARIVYVPQEQPAAYVAPAPAAPAPVSQPRSAGSSDDHKDDDHDDDHDDD